MIHFHGTPCGGKREDVARFLSGRHALIPFGRTEDIGTASEVCQSFVLDNGAFSAWVSGKPITKWGDYYNFVGEWMRHPAFAWAVIPDVIDGDEAVNDYRIDEWPFGTCGVPVWHLHESLERLDRLSRQWPVVALGSSGQFKDPGTRDWWHRMAEAMGTVCEDGQPRCKLHGLRMLDPAIFHRLPLTSADSTNAVRNGQRKSVQVGCNTLTGMTILADRIEAHQSAASWVCPDFQKVLVFE